MQTSTFAIIIRGTSADPAAVKTAARDFHAHLLSLGVQVDQLRVESAEHLDVHAEHAAARAEETAKAAEAALAT